MPMRIFMDTGAFLALEDESDEHHEEALQFRREALMKEMVEVISTSHILDETLTLTRSRLGIRASIDFSRKIRKSRVVKMLSVSKDIEEKALDVFERYDDKTFSFTDCVSFVVMREMGVKEAFTFDRHFVQMEFVKRPQPGEHQRAGDGDASKRREDFGVVAGDG